MKKIIFVCTGNTCRSPMAEGFLKDKLSKDGIVTAEVYSGGISVVSSYPASENAVAVMKEKGIDISSHRSRHISDVEDGADLIYAMTQSQAEILKLMFPEKAMLIHTLDKTDIPDPYGGDIPTYKASRDVIEAAVKAIYPRIKKDS